MDLMVWQFLGVDINVNPVIYVGMAKGNHVRVTPKTHELLGRMQRELAVLLNRRMTVDETIAWMLARAPAMLKRRAADGS